MLILESARVEIAVLLNELAYLKYDESPKSSTSREESIQQKQRSLAIAFSLLEKFIKMISSGAEGNSCGSFLLQLEAMFSSTFHWHSELLSAT